MGFRPKTRPENQLALSAAFHDHKTQPRFAPTMHAIMPRPARRPENEQDTGGLPWPRGAARRRRGYIGAGEMRLWRGDMRPGARGGCGEVRRDDGCLLTTLAEFAQKIFCPASANICDGDDNYAAWAFRIGPPAADYLW